MKAPSPGTPTASAVSRAVQILECLDGSRRPLNMSEISRKLKIPKSSAHVILLTLERLGYVERNAGGIHYSLGLKTQLLGSGLMKTLVLSDVAQPHMCRLAEMLGLTAHLAVADTGQGVFIQKVDAPGTPKLDTYVGRRIDFHCTAVGKVILAFGPEALREHVLSKNVYVRHTANTIGNPDVLSREVKRTRRLGYSLDDEEEELNVRCVAVPVFDDAGRFVAALSVSGTVRQISPEALPDLVLSLRRTAAEIGRQKAEPDAVSTSA
ncbi:MAG: IclR family transcriptional regulator [Bryobacteraceae bacterium]